jgi:hypothetical protein
MDAKRTKLVQLEPWWCIEIKNYGQIKPPMGRNKTKLGENKLFNDIIKDLIKAFKD